MCLFGLHAFSGLNIARLNPDGSLDTSFAPRAVDDRYQTPVECTGLQAEKILVGGMFTELAGQSRTNIGRLNPDGSLETSFSLQVLGRDGSFWNGPVFTVAPQPDGKILFGGRFDLPCGNKSELHFKMNIARANAAGSSDSSFGAW